MRARWVVGLLLAAAPLVACSAPNAWSDDRMIDVPSGAAVAIIGVERCPRDGTGVEFSGPGKPGGRVAGSIPAGFGAQTVIRCEIVVGSRQTVDHDRQRFRLDERETASTPTFLAALALSDQRFLPQSRVGCAAIYTPRPYVVLADARGRTLRVRLPQGPCGNPRGEAEAALAALPFTLVRSYRVVLSLTGG